MNLWSVLEDNVDLYDGRHCVAFWSWGSDEAIEYWRETYPEQCYLNEVSCTARIANTSAKPRRGHAHCESRMEVLREIGWMCEGDARCDTCGLYELYDLSPVCEGCNQCAECGCDCDDDELNAGKGE